SKWPEAITSYRKALELQPRFAQAQRNLEAVLASGAAAGEPPPIREGVPPAGDPARTCNVRGIALAREGRWDESIASFREAVRLRPNYPDAFNNLGNVLWFQRKLDEAVTAYEEAVRLAPNDAGAYANLGVVLRHQERLEEAVAACRRAV